ncbi:PREDICTED: acylglycerol kinase, mitochondrial [Ceratosolen solmsi marchali]|uniref:Acylglycerol kinase, mitochondrial n=1 Tax=Ceratosolen solmsi marchali TaxID=326594 RepID=A0AAJ6YKW1_9HYME|nr:PREDICTED: acylglycerol kinase, mitochondrial [Ceratosolen solmsi marchali]
MSRVINIFKVIRNNWKKSVAGTIVFSYGCSYFINTYEIKQVMRKYCEEAAIYGDQSLPTNIRPQQITVILNPASNNRKAKQLFEKYCEPLLHLAGFAVTIIQTQSENQARNLVANLNTHADAIVVAGGDGTLSDVVTGIMRKYKENKSIAKECPIGILPLGQTNKVADSLFYGYTDLIEVRKLVNATMAIVRGKTKLADVLEVELLDNDVAHPQESVYAIGTVEWGAWKDAQSRIDKYWYWGSLRKYVTYIFNGLKNDLNWECNGLVRYSDPCSGCSKCYKVEETTSTDRRWWHAFVPKVKKFSTGESVKDYSKVINNNCGVTREIPIFTTELSLVTQNVNQVNQSTPSIKIELGPKSINYTDFIIEGWQRLKGNKSLINKTFEVKDIEIHPSPSNNLGHKERTFYIDNEEFELKSVKFKLLPKTIKIFCSENKN